MGANIPVHGIHFKLNVFQNKKINKFTKHKIKKLKLQAAMNGPSQSTCVRPCCCRGVLLTRPHCPIIAYASLNCPCLDSAGRG